MAEENGLKEKDGLQPSAPVIGSVMDDLSWLDKYWRYFMDGERIGDIFAREMNGFKYTSATQIIGLMKIGKKP